MSINFSNSVSVSSNSRIATSNGWGSDKSTPASRKKNQPFAKSQYKIFVAEVASTVNETLLLKYMLKEAQNALRIYKRKKRYKNAVFSSTRKKYYSRARFPRPKDGLT